MIKHQNLFPKNSIEYFLFYPRLSVYKRQTHAVVITRSNKWNFFKTFFLFAWILNRIVDDEKTVYLELFIAWDNSITRLVRGVKRGGWHKKTLINICVFQLTHNKMENFHFDKTLQRFTLCWGFLFCISNINSCPLLRKVLNYVSAILLPLSFVNALFPHTLCHLNNIAICVSLFSLLSWKIFQCNDLKNVFSFQVVKTGEMGQGS